MNPTQQQVLAHVDQDAMIELASALVRIPSFKTEETPVSRFLADFFQPRGYGSTCRRSNPAASRPSPRYRGPGVGPA